MLAINLADLCAGRCSSVVGEVHSSGLRGGRGRGEQPSEHRDSQAEIISTGASPVGLPAELAPFGALNMAKIGRDVSTVS